MTLEEMNALSKRLATVERHLAAAIDATRIAGVTDEVVAKWNKAYSGLLAAEAMLIRHCDDVTSAALEAKRRAAGRVA